MKLVDFNKYKFKLRSLPNFKTFPKYFEVGLYFFFFLMIYNFLYICLVAKDFMPSLPTPFIIAFPIVFFRTYYLIEYEYRHVNSETIKEVIVHIRLKQTQSLLEKLEENPELIHGKYNKKSLLYWARHHQNVEANSIIIQQMKKSIR